MPNTVRRPDDDRRRWEAQRRRQREEAERREQARTSRDRRQRTTQLERQSLMGPMDLPFLLLTLLLTGVGLVMVFSASFPSAYYETGDGTYYFKRQLIFAVLGLFAMVVMSRINYQRLRGASKLLLGFAVFLLVLVIVPKNLLAITNNNATRWLGTQSFSFQPSEIAKLAVVIYFADSISKKKRKMETWRYGIVPYLAVLGLIAILMMLEPHLSGTILIVGTGIVMMIVGGIQRWLVAAGLGGVGIVAVLYVQLVEKGIIQYGKGRIDTWRDPFNEAWFHGDGWQISQSLIAIGSRRPAGCGTGQEPAEVPLSAGGAQRLHLCGGVRGAGSHRGLRGDAAVCAADPPWLLDRPPRQGPLRHPDGGGHYDPHQPANLFEHCGGHGTDSRHRYLIAVFQLRRHGAGAAII